MGTLVMERGGEIAPSKSNAEKISVFLIRAGAKPSAHKVPKGYSVKDLEYHVKGRWDNHLLNVVNTVKASDQNVESEYHFEDKDILYVIPRGKNS